MFGGRRRVWLIGLVLILIAGGAAAYILTRSNVTEAAQQGQEVQISVARRGNIIISATAYITVREQRLRRAGPQPVGAARES